MNTPLGCQDCPNRAQEWIIDRERTLTLRVRELELLPEAGVLVLQAQGRPTVGRVCVPTVQLRLEAMQSKNWERSCPKK